MKIKNVVVVALALAMGNAQAALFDRGGGLIYDDVLNITWLQDANYAKTSGYDLDGAMTLDAANEWAANLVYGGYGDWRLARNAPVGQDWNYLFSYGGTTDQGFNITSANSELSYMYYVNLGTKGQYSQNGTLQSTFGFCGIGYTGCGSGGTDSAVGVIHSPMSYAYWLATPLDLDPENGGWFFDAGAGYQSWGNNRNEFYAWAVSDGDVASAPAQVPEPTSLALLGLALAGLGATRRKKII